MTKDPVCVMEIDPNRAAGTRKHDDTIFYFCSSNCIATFDRDPHRYGHPH